MLYYRDSGEGIKGLKHKPVEPAFQNSPPRQAGALQRCPCPPHPLHRLQVSTTMSDHQQGSHCWKCKNFSPLSPLVHLQFFKHCQCYFYLCAASFSLCPLYSPRYVCCSCFGERKSKINIRNWSSPMSWAHLFWVVSILTLSQSVNML